MGKRVRIARLAQEAGEEWVEMKEHDQEVILLQPSREQGLSRTSWSTESDTAVRFSKTSMKKPSDGVIMKP